MCHVTKLINNYLAILVTLCHKICWFTFLIFEVFQFMILDLFYNFLYEIVATVMQFNFKIKCIIKYIICLHILCYH